jgi:hypothetical protein
MPKTSIMTCIKTKNVANPAKTQNQTVWLLRKGRINAPYRAATNAAAAIGAHGYRVRAMPARRLSGGVNSRMTIMIQGHVTGN